MPKLSLTLLFLFLPFTLSFRPLFPNPIKFPAKNSTFCDRSNFSDLRSDQLTVLINGFSESRLPLLQQIAAGYSSSPFVRAVYILWGNVSTPPELLGSREIESLGAPIFIFRQNTDSLNDRFLPRDFIETRAVAICDDDVQIDEKSMRFSFEIWRNSPEKIIGFFARSHDLYMTEKRWIYTVHPDKFSIVLTKFMILSVDYLYEYSCAMPEKIRQVVDKFRNCEDIAMNFIAAERTKSGPVLVDGKVRDWGDSRNSDEKNGVRDVGLSNRGDHRKNRGTCIGEFHKIFGRMSLRYSYGKMIDKVSEQGLCEKSGRLVFCDEQVESQ